MAGIEHLTRRHSLLLITHRPPDQPGGASARWRSLLPYLAERGWTVEVVCAHAVEDFGADASERARVQRRARLVARVRPLVRRIVAPLGIEPPPRSTLWLARGLLLAMRGLRTRPDVLVATAPPMVALLAARLALIGRRTPFVVDFRDLWVGNPMYDRGSVALRRLHSWVLRRADAIVVCSEAAQADLVAREPSVAARCLVIPNGFEPELLRCRGTAASDNEPLTLLHSGVLTPQRPLMPLLGVLAGSTLRHRIRLVLHGYLPPETSAEIAVSGLDVEIVPPSDWSDAVARIAAADVALITQSADAGDATAIASKVYEYLALGKPVLCISDGGATEALLRRLGAGQFCARLDDPGSIREALRGLASDALPPPLDPTVLAPYDRTRIALQLAETLEQLASRSDNVKRVDMLETEKAQVRSYWEARPCGADFAAATEGSSEFYAQVEAHRYLVEPHIRDFAGFERAAGQRVLEIGVGLGTDLVQFVRAGAEATGVDLTDAAVRNVQQRIAQEGLEATVQRADAEQLPFADGSFDRVYSWGVLHHTPRTDAAVREAIRVLRPGGELCVMLYYRHSWVVYGHWTKFALLRGKPFQGLNAVVRNHVESVGTKAYNRVELRHLFNGVNGLKIEIASTTYDRHFAGPLARLTGHWLGWNAIITGRKPG